MVTWLRNLQDRGMAFHAGVLGVAVLVVFAIAGPVGVHIHGSIALWAAALAGLLCLTGATAALAISHLLRGPHFALEAMLAGILARMGIPLAVALAIHLHRGPLAEAGLLYYLLVFYPVTLAIEIALTMPKTQKLEP
jgi:hypothetical protein